MTIETTTSGGVRQDGLENQTGRRSQALTARSCKVAKLCRLYRKKRGAAIVEFAVVAPVFILLIFGMIEYGRMVMVQQLLTNASREGARRAVLDGSTAAEVKAIVTDYLANSSIPAGELDVTIDPTEPSNAASGEPVTVSVSVPFDQVTWLPSPMYLGGTSMTASAVMRRESAE